MSKVLRAAGVAGLVILGAVGCSHCCGEKSTSAACPTGQCATGAPVTSMGPGTSATTMPMTVSGMPASGAPMTIQGTPATGRPTNGSTGGAPMTPR